MNYQTLEVELEHGMVRPRGEETLPIKARALLTIVEPIAIDPGSSARSMGYALTELGVLGKGEIDDLSTNKSHLADLGQ